MSINRRAFLQIGARSASPSRKPPACAQAQVRSKVISASRCYANVDKLDRGNETFRRAWSGAGLRHESQFHAATFVGPKWNRR